MRLGIIADIHEQVEYLQAALDRFHREQVDQVVVLGDVVETGERIDDTCRLLAAAKAVGVWGNHDFGLCSNPADDIRAAYPASVLDYLATLRPRLELAGCYFAHVEPWLDPEDIMDLWFFGGPPDSDERLHLIFNAVPHRLIFAGHYHRWLLATPERLLDWQGEGPISLRDGRFFVTVSALMAGRYAIFDTETSQLIPYEEPTSPARRA
ncbi:MAG: metallophosphoesterase family protein [Pirellulaceae bacterium]|nr:metallophosphoesterase family protein [Pirellulaceae bacterium]